MREDTFEVRLKALKRQQATPVGQEPGDLISPEWKIKDLREKLMVRLSYLDADPKARGGGYYAASRYYSISVHLEIDVFPGAPSIVCEITTYDLGRWADVSFPEANMILEELWLRAGGS